MKSKQIFDSYNKIEPDEQAKMRMLSHILAENTSLATEKRKVNIMKKHTFNKVMPIVACTAVVLIGAITIPKLIDTKPIAPIEQLAPAADSPTGMRKFMNYNGHRYQFLENGATYQLADKQLTKELGTLEYDILTDLNYNGTEDFATSFAIGGTIYEMNSYRPEFRVAVELDGSYYICESVDTIDDSEVKVSEYFKLANFTQIVKEIDVNDHSGNNVLDTISGKDATKMLDKLAHVIPTDLTDEQYQEIGNAQINGKSFLLSFLLKDGTQFNMYVIPTLSIAMIGDNNYTLTEDFITEYNDLFEGLTQQPIPMH